jgi:uncharacterized protein YgiM (DUF1202 family)
MKNRLSPLILLALFVAALATPACVVTGSSSLPTTPVVNITTPQNGSRFSIGEPVVVQFSAADVQGVNQIELMIDGQPIRVESIDPPVNSFVANHIWTPDSTGSHAIELRAFNVAGASSEPVKIFVTISEPLIGAAPSTPTPIAPLSSTPDTSSPTPVESTETLPTPTPAGQQPAGSDPMVMALVGLNVRSGPGTGYPVIGRLVEGQTAPITGRNPQGTWWQIVYPSDQGQRGWISGSAQFSTATNAEGVLIVEAPPLPTPAPTDTPVSLLPTIHSFTADRYSITQGESVVLRWDLSNALAAYLRYEDREEGVVAPGEKTVRPEKDTVYTLIARSDAGEVTAEVEIKVSGPAPTPVPVYRDGKTGIVPDQTIDFDQGVIQSGSSNPGADFYWDIQQRRFVPQSGSSGTFSGRSFDEITFEDCRGANYGQPLRDLNPGSRITGCYRTNEGRYGKYWVSEWDVSGNLTIVWLTWDYR